MIKYLYFSNTVSNEKQKDIDSVVDKLFTIYEYHEGKVRPSSEVKVKYIINNFIFNSLRVKSSKNKQLMFTLDNNFFSKKHTMNGTVCKLPYSFLLFKKVVDMLVYEGYVEVEKGGDFKYHEHVDADGVVWQIVDGRKSSIMKILEPTLHLIEEIHVTKKPFNINLLILRDEDKQDIPYEMTEVIKAQKKLLVAYNEFLCANEFKDKDGKDIDEPFLRRIYNGDWEHGGRFYTDRGVVQTMHQEDRNKITVNGEKVCEIDISSCFPTIAYTLCGEVMDVDPYDFRVDCKINQEEIDAFKKEFNLVNYDPLRNIKKKIMLLSFTTDFHRLSFAISKKLGDDKFTQVAKDPNIRKNAEFVGLSFVRVSEGIQHMKEHNHKILGMFNKLCYQNLEGRLMHNVLNYALQNNVIMIPVHDSVVTPLHQEEQSKEIISQAFTDTFGSNINLKLKVRK